MKKNKTKAVASTLLATMIAFSSVTPTFAAPEASFKPTNTPADSYANVSIFHSHDFGDTENSDKNFGDIANPYHTSSYVPLWSYKDGSNIGVKDTAADKNSKTDSTSVNPFVLRASDANKNETVAYTLGDRYSEKDNKLTGTFASLPTGAVTKADAATPANIQRILIKGYPNVSAVEFNKANSTSDITDQDLEWATQMAISLVLSNPDIATKDAEKNVQDFFAKSFKTISSDTAHATAVERATQILVKASNDSSVSGVSVDASGPSKAQITTQNGTIVQGPYKFTSSAAYDIDVSATVKDSTGKDVSIPAELTTETNGGGTVCDTQKPVTGDKSYYLYVKDVPKDAQNVDIDIAAKSENAKTVQVDTFHGTSSDAAALVVPASYTPYSHMTVKASTASVDTTPVSVQMKDKDGNVLANTDTAEIEIHKASDNSLVDTKTTTSNPTVFNLHEGQYYCKETKAPTGYKLNTDSADKHSFSVEKTDAGDLVLKNSQNLTFVQEPTSVTLTRVDSATSKGVSGTTFSVFAKNDTDTPVVAPEVTNDNGEVTFTGLPAGDYVYKETASTDGKAQNKNIYNFTINPDGTLSSTGTYVFSDKSVDFRVKIADSTTTTTGLSGAEVSVFQKDNLNTPLLVKTSDKDGDIDFNNFPFVGDFVLMQTKAPEGYTKDNTTIAFRVTEDGSVKDATAGTTISPSSPLSFKDQGTSLVMNVNDETGSAMPDVSFVLKDVNNPSKTFTAKSDNSGNLSFVGIVQGTYTLSQYSIPSGYFKIPDSTVSVDAAGKLSKDVSNKIQLKPTSVTISKSDFDKKTPIEGTSITITSDADKTKTYSAKTDSKGIASFSKIPVGKYVYSETAPSTGYQTMSDKIPFEIKEDGSVIGNLTITNKKTSACIKCVDPSGNPIANATVSLKDSQGKAVGQISGISGTDGIINFSYLPSGDYYASEDIAPAGYVKPSTTTHFLINKDGATIYDQVNQNLLSTSTASSAASSSNSSKTSSSSSAPSSSSASSASSASSSSSASSASSSSSAFSVKFPNTAAYIINTISSISIKVTDGSDNTPIIGAEYEITDSSNNTFSVKTDSKGFLNLSGKEAAIGSYNLVEKKAPDGYIVDSETKTLIISDTGFSIDNDVNAVLKNQKTEVTITLTDKETGSALAGGKFCIKDANNKVVFNGETTKEGAMTIYGLPVGSYTFTQTAAPTGYKSTTAQYGFKIDKTGAVSGDTTVVNCVSGDSLGLVDNPSSDGTPTNMTAGTDTQPVDDGSATGGKTDTVKTGIESETNNSAPKQILLASAAALGAIGAFFGIKKSIRRKKDVK